MSANTTTWRESLVKAPALTFLAALLQCRQCNGNIMVVSIISVLIAIVNWSERSGHSGERKSMSRGGQPNNIAPFTALSKVWTRLMTTAETNRQQHALPTSILMTVAILHKQDSVHGKHSA